MGLLVQKLGQPGPRSHLPGDSWVLGAGGTGLALAGALSPQSHTCSRPFYLQGKASVGTVRLEC